MGYLHGWTGLLCIFVDGCILRLETKYDHYKVQTKVKFLMIKNISRFENSELPVTELDFPAVTICSQGLNMDNVAKVKT